jgi:putative DNA primase/helicase
MQLSEVLAKFDVVGSETDGFLARCPAHDDARASLRITATDDRKVLVTCRAGCSFQDVLAAAGLTARQLFDVTNDVGASLAPAGPRAVVSGGAVALLKLYLTEAAERFVGSPAEQYVLRRFGLAAEEAVQAGLGFDPGDGAIPCEWTSKAWNFGPRLVVPFRSFDGVARGAQGRDLTGQSRARWASLTNPPDAAWSKLAVFRHDANLDTFIITEGPGDALTAFAAGYNAVAVRGAALSSNEGLVRELVEGLDGTRVLVCGDADRAGQEFAGSLSRSLADAGLSVFTMVVPFGESDLSAAFESDPVGFPSALEAADRDAEPPVPTRARPPAQESDDDFELTDLGNAQRLVASFGAGNLRYVEELGFMVHSAGTWEIDRLDSVRTAAQDLAQALGREARSMIEAGQASRDSALEQRGKRLLAHSKTSQSTRAIEAMMKEARSVKGVRASIEDFDQHHHLLAFTNGVVDLRSGKLLPHDRDLLLTRRIALPYDPDARCPRWEQFLSEVFPKDPDLPAFMQRLVGYGITGDTSEQAFAILWGLGANGKSVFTDTLSFVFDSITTTTPFTTFERRPAGGIPNDLAALRGARLVFASEGEQGVPMAEATLKRVTGQDLITARFLRREFFSFRPTFLIFLATNYKPAFRGQDEGLWRRVKLIPWERYFAPSERDPRLVYKLREEAAGIAAWAVRGATEWFARGLQEPPSVVGATKEYRAGTDALSGFFPGVIEAAGPDDVVPVTAVWGAYLNWCDEENLPGRERWTRRALYAALEERGLARRRRADGTYFAGLVLHARPTVPDLDALAHEHPDTNDTADAAKE